MWSVETLNTVSELLAPIWFTGTEVAVVSPIIVRVFVPPLTVLLGFEDGLHSPQGC